MLVGGYGGADVVFGGELAEIARGGLETDEGLVIDECYDVELDFVWECEQLERHLGEELGADQGRLKMYFSGRDVNFLSAHDATSRLHVFIASCSSTGLGLDQGWVTILGK